VSAIDSRRGTEIAAIREANKSYFDHFADSYDQRFGIYYDDKYAQYFLKRFEIILGNLPRADVVLDIGCGTGYVLLNLVRLKRISQAAYGCDVSAGMLKVCNLNAQRLGVEVLLTVSDAERLPYCAKVFDMVVGHAILHHIPDIEQTLCEAYRLTKEGGMCLFFGEEVRKGSKFTRWPGKVLWCLPRRFLFLQRRGKTVESNLQSSTDLKEPDLEIESIQVLKEAAIKAGFSKIQAVTSDFTSAMYRSTVDPIVFRLGDDRSREVIRNFELLLLRLDQHVLKRFLPADWFCGVSLMLRK
jgi:ubiquinone/menaquinone biosynthesis C-methylase UbiE